MSPYMTVKEVAELLRLNEETVRNKMYTGVFREGLHYFKQRGLGPRFKRAALEAWVEGREEREDRPATRLRMAKGYFLGNG